MKTKVLVNLRSSAKKANNVIKTLKKDTTVEVVKSGKTWTEVKVDHVQGFIMTQFLEEKGEK
ncbi:MULTISPECIES: SH3 domain-containing protein [unclassified Breznakia]|uniref:SH3 domain-containing protein n=1 Tax=unclassified Breznakia TaxID=2623764 RepID=UPI0024750AC1|nr:MULTISPECIES: SH3 domain-containing protein [unclassified Breznakia]MDH6367134.1 SH3-like domain-containing protein [Breznakia sp. PH1-1]MDH6404279.1 SH3-like domain-containing protein [Breznakia sp. PF1-11]MDH6412022.1 SH3-like domain-containing protein [Breznakia sp. PFB1-11]MDH6414267.1 SH3-like domain-containing protein [Breznakia sp. PFB1-14]MDH6416636.1 SH3-like domain-containing protein [Breznakia sp. PFB1-4]